LGGKLNLRSEFSQAKDYWVKTNRDARRAYLSTIGVYLSYNLEGRIIKELVRIQDKKMDKDQMTSAELKELRKKIAGFIGMVVKTRKDVRLIISDYELSGLHQSVF
jgi:ribosomal protein S17E